MILRRRVVVAFSAFGVWWGGWGALLPALQRSAGVDDGQLGSALLLIGVGALASMRVTGYLIDRFGAVVLPVSVASFGVAGVLPSLVDGVPLLATSLAVVGAGGGAYDVAINAEANRVETTSERPLMNLAHVGFAFGVIAGSLGAGALRMADVSLTAALGASATVLVLVAGWLARDAGYRPVVGYAVARAKGGWRWWRPPRALAVLGGLLALAFLIESVWLTWSAVHLERDLGAPAGVASLGPAVFGASAGLGRMLAHRWTVRGNEGRLVAIGAMVAAGGSVGAALVPATPLVLLAIAFAGLGTAACAPSLLSLAGRSAPLELSGAAVGTVTTVGYLGFVLAPAFVGGLAGATTLPTALAAVALPATALAISAARRRSPRRL